MKLLLIEDDIKILSFVKKGLEEEGFLVDTAQDGSSGFYLASEFPYDALVVDWMLPGIQGDQLCMRLRAKKITTPVLMLTAKNTLEEKVHGLNCGADDYLCKPFEFAELVARLNALLRRTSYHFDETITLDTLKITVPKRHVSRSNRLINLTSKEFDMLMLLLLNKGSVLTHTQLQEKIWGISESTSSNVINVFIHHLRQKIDTEGEKKLIKTVRGSGYKIDDT
ncbi:response regulator transcription factor [Sulfurospirillum sp. T05]|uniref:Response regulator transcription factor n=1 Tax=Sulfurospirillum tamanense TaxID=2813362 RepID=A0ABS2WU47_9BACT|nr:response regulator transcription factor [Sulfurospirillum tamanensis]MBN2965025.1 response regulator transcription factor [Sulfurospirillum tamanensis]